MHANNAIESLQEEDTQKGKYLTFSLGEEYYAIEIKYVTEIIGMQPISEIPELPDYVKGIINLRGKIIPVMDVRLRFKKPWVPYNDRTCVIVIEIAAIAIGLIVDLVSEVLVIPDDAIVPPPEVSQGGNRFIKGIGTAGKDVKLLLDCERLINENEMNLLEESL